MTTVIYADSLFIINASIDYICFFCVYRFFNIKTNIKRILIASFVGGVYGIASIFIINYLLHIIVLFIICGIAFKFNSQRFLKKTTIYLLISSMVGGISTAIENIFGESKISLIYLLFSCFITITFLCRIKKRKINNNIFINIEFGEYVIGDISFVDSGNLLKDPYTGKNVILLKKEILKKEFVIEKQKGFRIIPVNYRDEKILKCFVPDKITIKYKNNTYELDAIVAIDNTEGYYGDYLILIPELLIGEII